MREINVRLTDSDMTRMLRWKESEGFKDRDWGDFFRFKTAGFPLADSVGEIIGRNTETMFEMWCLNFARNLTYHHVAHDKGSLQALQSLPLQNLRDARELVPPNMVDTLIGDCTPVGPAIVVGRGPSIWKHNHLKVLAASDYKGAIVTSDGMLVECLRAGVTPDRFSAFHVVSVDGHGKLIVKWFGDENFDENNPEATDEEKERNRENVALVNKYGSGLKVIAGSTVANNVVRRCLRAGAKVYLVHPVFDALGYESITRMMMNMTQTDETAPYISVQSGGNAGTLSWILSWNLLRCSPILLIGMTFGYEPETPIEETAYASKALALGDLEGATQSIFEVKNPHDEQVYRTDHIFMQYKKSFFDMLDATPPPVWLKTWNCTEGGILFGHKRIEWKRFKDALQEFEHTRTMMPA